MLKRLDALARPVGLAVVRLIKDDGIVVPVVGREQVKERLVGRDDHEVLVLERGGHLSLIRDADRIVGQIRGDVTVSIRLVQLELGVLEVVVAVLPDELQRGKHDQHRLPFKQVGQPADDARLARARAHLDKGIIVLL